MLNALGFLAVVIMVVIGGAIVNAAAHRRARLKILKEYFGATSLIRAKNGELIVVYETSAEPVVYHDGMKVLQHYRDEISLWPDLSQANVAALIQAQVRLNRFQSLKSPDGGCSPEEISNFLHEGYLNRLMQENLVRGGSQRQDDEELAIPPVDTSND